MIEKFNIMVHMHSDFVFLPYEKENVRRLIFREQDAMRTNKI